MSQTWAGRLTRFGRPKEAAPQTPENAGEDIDVGDGDTGQARGGLRGFFANFKTDTAGDQCQWTVGNAWKTRLGFAVVIAVAASGPAALVLQQTHSAPPPVVQSAGYDTAKMARQEAAGQTAIGWVSTWLEASNADSAGVGYYWPTDQTLTFPAQPMKVTDGSVQNAYPSAPGVWTITVAANVTPPGGSPARRFFTVPVAVAGTRNPVSTQVLALPSEVAAPSNRVGSISTSYGSQIPQTSPAYATVQQFLAAMLSGQGSITRYLRPGVSISAVAPPPWQQVQLQALESDSAGASLASTATQPDGTRIHVLATVALTPPTPNTGKGGSSTSPASPGSGTGDSPTTVTGQYELSLTSRAGRWEVSGLDQAPLLSTANQQAGTP